MRMIAPIVVAMLILSNAVTAQGASDSTSCLVDGMTISAAECQSTADASWEGLDGGHQRMIGSLGLQGTALDQYVIDFRSGYRIDEDEPSWDCTTMGNRICGPELPRTL